MARPKKTRFHLEYEELEAACVSARCNIIVAMARASLLTKAYGLGWDKAPLEQDRLMAWKGLPRVN